MWPRQRRPPTDFELLKAIYDRYRAHYKALTQAGVIGRVYVKVDLQEIARDLHVPRDSVFGRLYHHLEELYGERDVSEEGRPRKAFYLRQRKSDGSKMMDLVNFPLLEAILAGLWQQRDRDTRTYWAAIGSLVLSAVAIGVSILVATGNIG